MSSDHPTPVRPPSGPIARRRWRRWAATVEVTGETTPAPPQGEIMTSITSMEPGSHRRRENLRRRRIPWRRFRREPTAIGSEDRRGDVCCRRHRCDLCGRRHGVPGDVRGGRRHHGSRPHRCPRSGLRGPRAATGPAGVLDTLRSSPRTMHGQFVGVRRPVGQGSMEDERVTRSSSHPLSLVRRGTPRGNRTPNPLAGSRVIRHTSPSASALVSGGMLNSYDHGLRSINMRRTPT